MTIADSNVLLDIIYGKGEWFEWSSARLDEAGAISINPMIYAEIAPAFEGFDALDRFVTEADVTFLQFTPAALYAGGLAHARYRASGGKRDRVLRDFLIGAQASTLGLPLLTRDPRPYRTYFPDVRLITP